MRCLGGVSSRMAEVTAQHATIWSRAQDSWHHTRPAVRALWMFFLVPGILIGLLALLAPTAARAATTVLSPMLVIAAGVWMNQNQEAAEAVRHSNRRRTMLLVLIGLFLAGLLLAKLYS